MMDFFIREGREIVDGQMYVIRFGTCGTINKDHEVGIFAVNEKGAIMVQRNPSSFMSEGEGRVVIAWEVGSPASRRATVHLLQALPAAQGYNRQGKPEHLTISKGLITHVLAAN